MHFQIHSKSTVTDAVTFTYKLCLALLIQIDHIGGEGVEMSGESENVNSSHDPESSELLSDSAN